MKNTSVEKKIELVEVNKLRLDYYQRSSGITLRAKQMAKEFNEMLLTTIIVSRREGQLYVVDGGNRTYAAKANQIKTMMALVYDGLTYEEESNLFILLNTTSKPLTSTDVFKAAVEAKHVEALAIRDIVENLGFRIAKASGINTIAAVRELQNIYNKHGNSHLYNTLLLIKRAWGGERETLSAKMMKGVSEFIKIYEKEYAFSKEVFIRQLSKVTAKQILAESKTDLSTNSVNIRVMKVLFKHYNARLRNNKLEDKHFIA